MSVKLQKNIDEVQTLRYTYIPYHMVYHMSQHIIGQIAFVDRSVWNVLNLTSQIVPNLSSWVLTDLRLSLRAQFWVLFYLVFICWHLVRSFGMTLSFHCLIQTTHRFVSALSLILILPLQTFLTVCWKLKHGCNSTSKIKLLQNGNCIIRRSN